MAGALFSKLSDDVVLNILFKLEEDPRNWARLACSCTKFSSMIRNVCWKTKCYKVILLILLLLTSSFHISFAGLLAEPVTGNPQPLKPGENSTPNTVPAFPTQNPTQTCHLDLSAELFGGVSQACGRNLDRSRCCPVLAAWLFAAHARSALELPSSAPDPSTVPDQPMMPDDSQKCVNSLQSSLVSRNIRIPLTRRPITLADPKARLGSSTWVLVGLSARAVASPQIK